MQIRCNGLAFGVRGIGDTMAGWLDGWGLWRWNGVLGLGYEAYDTLFEEPFPISQYTVATHLRSSTRAYSRTGVSYWLHTHRNYKIL
jgi:hypothetical protein